MTADPYPALEALCGPPATDPTVTEAATRAVQVRNAHAAALAWVRQTTGEYPAQAQLAERLTAEANLLREDDRDPSSVLIQTAADAVAQSRASSAA